MKILIIEDDKNILSLLKRGFIEYGFSIESAQDGEDGEYMATVNKYDVIVLDWMLPSKNGIKILESIRDKGIKTPVIMLSAKSDIDDKVLGLRYGADDYLSKPFSFKELRARVEALYRRGAFECSNTISVRDIELNLLSKVVKKENKEIILNFKEYELLLFLLKNRNIMVSNHMIEEQLWFEQDFVNSNVIQVTIYNLRKKVGKDFIKSYRGLGYKIEA